MSSLTFRFLTIYLVESSKRFKTMEHKIGIDLTVSLTLKKPSKNYTFLF